MITSSISACSLKKGLEQDKFSATDIIKALLKRIKSIDTKINAYITLFEEEALFYAGKIDSYSNYMEYKGCLAGLPLAISSNLSDSISDSFGSKIIFTNRLKDEGAIIIGTSNIEFNVNNPWNISRSAGTSSGGSAAAIASGMASLAVSLDSWIRIEESAAFCGVLGFKPSKEIIYDSLCFKDEFTENTIGLFSKNVQDCILLAGALSDKLKIQSTESSNITLDKLRIVVIDDMLDRCCNSEIKNNIENAILLFNESGCSIKRISLKSEDAMETGKLLKQLFESSDIALYPSTYHFPYKNGDRNSTEPVSYNISENFPSLSMPCSFSSEDLPIGLTLTADTNNDLYLLQAAHLLEAKLAANIF